MQTLFCILVIVGAVLCEPVVISGAMIPSLLGAPVERLRVLDHTGAAIPFQVDEVTPDDDFVCPDGPEPNTGNGVLDSADEIVFMREDADTVPVLRRAGLRAETVVLERAGVRCFVFVADYSEAPLSPKRYVTYDAATEAVTTPYYYAAFAHDRFHFVRAGVRDFPATGYRRLTNELRIRIHLRTLWGLLPITYSEDNIVCLVKRYKAGPVRLIRRGDFHLNLGMWLKGSHAAVNQLCYPDMVRVPVYVHLPVRFRSLFSEAYIEMTPVIREEGRAFSFRIPDHDVAIPIAAAAANDTFIPVNPNNTLYTLDNGTTGYGWLLSANIQEAYCEESGFLCRRTTDRGAIGYCGLRLSVRDLPKGYYLITNWVVFSQSGSFESDVRESAAQLGRRAGISGTKVNLLGRVQKFRKR